MVIKLPFKSGDGQDVFSEWRHVMCWHTRQKKTIKRRYNKRVRRCFKMEIEIEKYELNI